MFTKGAMRILLAVSLLVIMLLAVKVLVSKSTPETNTVARSAYYYTGSDWIERHPVATLPVNYYAGSDWIEPHPMLTQPINYYSGSDWIERHPCEPTP